MELGLHLMNPWQPLSGGLDSSALAALIAPFAPLLVTTAGTSPVDDDLTRASRAAAVLPGSEHRVLHPGEMPCSSPTSTSPAW
jgi:asparagine synthase (glutamine-hydrolysing)